MAKKNGDKTTPVDSHRHRDKRTNIPTEELRDFVREEEQAPKEIQYPGLLYARDPSLDPQLVWKGKDEQDRKPLTVPAVPIYIQEKIHPRRSSRTSAPRPASGSPRSSSTCSPTSTASPSRN